MRQTQYDVMGLEAQKKYVFRVSAENQYGVSDPLTMDDGIIAKYPFTVPDAPSAPRVTDYDSTSATLTWDRPLYDGGSRIQGYKIEMRNVEDTTWQSTGFLVKDTTYNVFNLEQGREYEFRVRAKNAAGLSKPSGPSSRFRPKGRVDVPSAPGAPQVVHIGRNYVDLSWTPPEHDGGARVSGYIVERREIGGALWIRCNEYNVTDTNYTAINLFDGTEYEFRIIAVNSAGKSEPSAPTAPVRVCEVAGGEKPQWIRPLADTVVAQGKTLELVCEARGKPEPNARWLKNGREITGVRCTTESRNGVFRLQLSDVQRGDEGNYVCEAVNSLGSVQTSSHVRVGVPPRIDKMPDEVQLAEHENAKIKIFYAGDQPIEAKLLRDGKPAGRLTFTVFDEAVAIYVRDAQAHDGGFYQIELTNDNGSVTGTFNLRVTRPPGKKIWISLWFLESSKGLAQSKAF